MENKKAILPISYFGSIGKYAILKQVPSVIEKHENFQKRSIRNRMQILGANGPMILSIPLKKGKNQKLISLVEIAYFEDWQRDHLMTIRSAFGSAPYFDYYFEKIQQVIKQEHIYLIDMFEATYNCLKSILNLPNLHYTDTFKREFVYSTSTLDFRNKSFDEKLEIPQYFQVFEDKFGFISNLSILDLIFNLGPEASVILSQTKFKL